MTPVHIAYRLTRGLDETAVAGDLSCLSADERARGSRFTSAEDRRDFLAAHLLLRHSLSALEPRDPALWSFTRCATGKPCLDDRAGRHALTFNLSHTRGLVACIVTRGADVGIDVEPVVDHADLLAVARAHFSKQEVHELERDAPAERAGRFAAIWTLKEAYFKATGAGIAGGLDGLAVTLDAASPFVRFETDGVAGADEWHWLLLAVADFRLAAAVRVPGEVVSFVVDEPAGSTGGTAPARLLRLAPAGDLLRAGGVG